MDRWGNSVDCCQCGQAESAIDIVAQCEHCKEGICKTCKEHTKFYQDVAGYICDECIDHLIGKFT